MPILFCPNCPRHKPGIHAQVSFNEVIFGKDTEGFIGFVSNIINFVLRIFLGSCPKAATGFPVKVLPRHMDTRGFCKPW